MSVCALSSRFSVSPPGAVFVNGKEMTNQLPAVTVGSSVTFDMEVVNIFPVSNNNNPSDKGNFKLRVTIGSGNREVVFDWLLDQVVDSLFFGCSFTHPGWKVLVFWLFLSYYDENMVKDPVCWTVPHHCIQFWIQDLKFLLNVVKLPPDFHTA